MHVSFLCISSCGSVEGASFSRFPNGWRMPKWALRDAECLSHTEMRILSPACSLQDKAGEEDAAGAMLRLDIVRQVQRTTLTGWDGDNRNEEG